MPRSYKKSQRSRKNVKSLKRSIKRGGSLNRSRKGRKSNKIYKGGANSVAEEIKDLQKQIKEDIYGNTDTLIEQRNELLGITPSDNVICDISIIHPNIVGVVKKLYKKKDGKCGTFYIKGKDVEQSHLTHKNKGSLDSIKKNTNIFYKFHENGKLYPKYNPMQNNSDYSKIVESIHGAVSAPRPRVPKASRARSHTSRTPETPRAPIAISPKASTASAVGQVIYNTAIGQNQKLKPVKIGTKFTEDVRGDVDLNASSCTDRNINIKEQKQLKKIYFSRKGKGYKKFKAHSEFDPKTCHLYYKPKRSKYNQTKGYGYLKDGDANDIKSGKDSEAVYANPKATRSSSGDSGVSLTFNGPQGHIYEEMGSGRQNSQSTPDLGSDYEEMRNVQVQVPPSGRYAQLMSPAPVSTGRQNTSGTGGPQGTLGLNYARLNVHPQSPGAQGLSPISPELYAGPGAVSPSGHYAQLMSPAPVPVITGRQNTSGKLGLSPGAQGPFLQSVYSSPQIFEGHNSDEDLNV